MNTITRTLRDRSSSPRRGFSLIELAVVVAILGILAAIAIPTFLGQRRGAQDRQAQSALRNTLTLARAEVAETDHGNYPADLVSALAAAEKSFAFTAGVSTDPSTISVAQADPTTAVFTARSVSGTCWVVVSSLTSGATYGAFEAAECDAAVLNPGEIVGDTFGQSTVLAAESGDGTGLVVDTGFPLTDLDLELRCGAGTLLEVQASWSGVDLDLVNHNSPGNSMGRFQIFLDHVNGSIEEWWNDDTEWPSRDLFVGSGWVYHSPGDDPTWQDAWVVTDPAFDQGSYDQAGSFVAPIDDLWFSGSELVWAPNPGETIYLGAVYRPNGSGDDDYPPSNLQVWALTFPDCE